MKTYTLPFQKAANPVSFKQVEELKSFGNLKTIPSTSQVTKRMDQEMFEEILNDLKKNEEVSINN